MNLLPRFLFSIFQTLPINVPISVFNMLDKLISKFIWQKKKPKIRFKTLLLSKEKGGLDLPSLKHYYWTAQLSAVVAWVGNDSESGWAIKGTSLSNLHFINIKPGSKIKIDNE